MDSFFKSIFFKCLIYFHVPTGGNKLFNIKLNSLTSRLSYVITHSYTSPTRKWVHPRRGGAKESQQSLWPFAFCAAKTTAPFFFYWREQICHGNSKKTIIGSSPLPTHAHTRRATPSTKWRRGWVYTVYLSLATASLIETYRRVGCNHA